MTLSEWDWRTGISMPPPGGKVGSDTGGWESTVTSLYFSTVNGNGVDQGALLRDTLTGSKISIHKATDSTVFSSWLTTGPGTESTGYFTFPVSFVDSVGTPTAVTMTCQFEAPALPSLDQNVVQLANIAAILIAPTQCAHNCEEAVSLAVELYFDCKTKLAEYTGATI